MPSYVTDANLSSKELAFCGGMAGVVSRYNGYSVDLVCRRSSFPNIFCRVVIAPLDVVKIRMQLQTHRTHFGFGNRSASMAPSPDIKYSRITQAMKTILKEEGIRVKVTLFGN